MTDKISVNVIRNPPQAVPLVTVYASLEPREQVPSVMALRAKCIVEDVLAEAGFCRSLNSDALARTIEP